MDLDTFSQLAGIGSFLLGIFTVTGLRIVYNKVSKQENTSTVVINNPTVLGDLTASSSNSSEIKQ